MALGLGTIFVMREFPWSVALGHAPDSMLFGDAATHAIGQRYFIADSWRWPLLTTQLLEPPRGVNIALMDSIPLAAMLAKLFHAILPSGFTPLFPWLAVCYLAQPVAAVFALRGAGETRIFPAACAALMAICCPTLLFRTGHAALCSHFLILLALGLYFRTVQRNRPMPAATILLLLASLLVHPYLLMMVAAVLAAAPVSLSARGAAWWPATYVLALALLLTGALAFGLGYGGSNPGGGFGMASMNILSPFYPAYSALLRNLLPGLDHPLDATGFQYEGYQYLGLGLMFLLCANCFASGQFRNAFALRRHAGLWVCCICLSLFAISDVVYAGQTRLFDAKLDSGFLDQLRASGRFFWPVTYVLLITAIVRLFHLLPYRAAAAVLLFAAGLQYLDTAVLRGAVAAHTHGVPPVRFAGPNPRLLLAAFMRGLAHGPARADTIDETRLHALLAQHDRLTIWPTVACGLAVSATPEFLPLEVAASDTVMPVNTAYLSREAGPTDCDAQHVAGQPLGAGELRVFMPVAAKGAAQVVPNGSQYCHALGSLTVCSLR